MKFILTILLKGLVVVVPIGATLFVIYWLGESAETLLAPALKLFMPPDGPVQYHTGMGVLAGVVVVFVIGLLSYSFIFRAIFALDAHAPPTS